MAGAVVNSVRAAAAALTTAEGAAVAGGGAATLTVGAVSVGGALAVGVPPYFEAKT